MLKCSKLIIKTLERRQLCHLGIFVNNFEHCTHRFFIVSIVDFEQVNVYLDNNFLKQ